MFCCQAMTSKYRSTSLFFGFISNRFNRCGFNFFYTFRLSCLCIWWTKCEMLLLFSVTLSFFTGCYLSFWIDYYLCCAFVGWLLLLQKCLVFLFWCRVQIWASWWEFIVLLSLLAVRSQMHQCVCKSFIELKIVYWNDQDDTTFKENKLEKWTEKLNPKRKNGKTKKYSRFMSLFAFSERALSYFVSFVINFLQSPNCSRFY